MCKSLFIATLFLATLLGMSQANAKQVRFASAHPLPAELGGGYCYIEYPHVHVFEPAQADVLYRNTPNGYFFIGDPVPYGYQGPRFAYYGPHPVVIGEDRTEYDYLEGPHYHSYAPPETLKFKVKGDVRYYAGDLPPTFVSERPRYAKINVVYKPLRYERPIVTEGPPPEYHGPIVEASVVAPQVVVAPAVVGIHAGVSLDVGIHAPTVVIGGPAVVHDRVEVIEVRGKHDNGRHLGEVKHGKGH